VANGTYTVTLTSGIATATRDKMAISLEGNLVESNITTKAGQFVQKTYTVQVTDGQLTVRLQDLGGRDPYAVINALTLTRTGN